MELIKEFEVYLGFVVFVTLTVAGLVTWGRKRIASVAAEGLKPVVAQQTLNTTAIVSLAGLKGPISENDMRIGVIEQKVARIEASQNAMPSKDDFHQLQLQMAEMNGALGKITAVIEGNAKVLDRFGVIVDRQEEYLLNSGK